MLVSRAQLLPIILPEVPGLCEYASLNSWLAIKKLNNVYLKRYKTDF